MVPHWVHILLNEKGGKYVVFGVRRYEEEEEEEVGGGIRKGSG